MMTGPMTMTAMTNISHFTCKSKNHAQSIIGVLVAIIALRISSAPLSFPAAHKKRAGNRAG